MADVEHSAETSTEQTGEETATGVAATPSSEMFFIETAARWTGTPAEEERNAQYVQWENALDQFRHANPEGYADFIEAIKEDPRVQQQMPQLTLTYLKSHYGDLHSALILQPVIPKDAIDHKLQRDDDLGIESIFLKYASEHYEDLSNLVATDGADGQNEIALSKSDMNSVVLIDHALWLQDKYGDTIEALQANFEGISKGDGEIQVQDLRDALLATAQGGDEQSCVAASLALRDFASLSSGDMHDGDFYWKPLFELGFGNNDGITRNDLASLAERYAMLQGFGITPETTTEAKRAENEYRLAVFQDFVRWRDTQPPATTFEENLQQMRVYNGMLSQQGKATHTIGELLAPPPGMYGQNGPGYSRDVDADGNRGDVQGP